VRDGASDSEAGERAQGAGERAQVAGERAREQARLAERRLEESQRAAEAQQASLERARQSLDQAVAQRASAQRRMGDDQRVLQKDLDGVKDLVGYERRVGDAVEDSRGSQQASLEAEHLNAGNERAARANADSLQDLLPSFDGSGERPEQPERRLPGPPRGARPGR